MNPESETNPEIGRFSLTEEEKEKIAEKATRIGKSPEEFMRTAQAEMDRANARLQDEERQRSIEAAERKAT